MTRKTTPYARRRARMAHQRADHLRTAAQPVLAELIQDDIASLQTTAGLHAWTGQDAANITNLGGRLCYIAAGAGGSAGISPDAPDMRIIRGMASALGDLLAHPAAIEAHRASIQSGLLAVKRVLALVELHHVVAAAQELEGLLATTQGLGTADVRAAMGMAEID